MFKLFLLVLVVILLHLVFIEHLLCPVLCAQVHYIHFLI